MARKSAESTRAGRPQLRPFFAGSLLAALVLFYFTGDKPLHIDDPLYVFTARQMARNPFKPYDFLINWEGLPVPAAAYAAYHTPLWPGLLAIPIKLGGEESERRLHAVQVPFVALALAAAAGLAGYFAAPLWPVFSFLALSPAFMVSAATLMPDIPCLALFLAGFLCFLLVPFSPYAAPAGAAFLLGSGLMKFSVLPLLPAIAFGIWSVKKRFRTTAFIWLAISTAVLALWPAAILLFGGGEYRFDLLPSWQTASGAASAASKLAYSLTTLGTTVVHPGIWLVLLGMKAGRKHSTILLLGGAITFLAASQLRYFGVWQAWASHLWAAAPDGANRSWALIGTLCFSWWLAAAALEQVPGFGGAKSPGRRLLLLWIGCSVAGALIGSPFPAVRYVLLGVPAVVILAALELAPLMKLRFGRSIVAAAVLSTAWLGILVTWSDMRQAVCARDLTVMAADFARNEGGTTWLAGHWGYQYYGETLGIRTAAAIEDRINAGDVIIYPVNASRHSVIIRKGLKTVPLAALRCEAENAPMCTMAQRQGVGFYGAGWIPYGFSRGPLDALELKRVVPGAESP